MKTVDLSRFNNSWYKPAGIVKSITWYFTNALFFNTPLFPLNGLKVRILRLFGASVGRGVIIKPSVNIKYPWLLSVGNYTWIGEHVWIDNLAEVIIHDSVCISQGALLLCGNHNYKSVTFDLIIGKIELECGVWVGARSVVCPGVTMRSHSILSVGSVLQKNTEAFTIYQGNPAIAVRKRVITG
ncbi:MAG: colanic acid biosynthesis acetyltransferase WcaF [Ignavibacteriales bacterium]|nr:colanic acid biosynthesis acetyltransferase WcaF [Ignavibacteriales bacterium]